MDVLEVELRISEGNSEVVIGKARKNLEDFVKETESKSPTLKMKVAGESFIDLDKLEKRAAETRKQFAAITSARLDVGQVGNLTKDLVRASERSRQLSSDISSIKRELANPNRKSSIAFLTDELKAAEKEASDLNRKLSSLPSQNGGRGGKSSSGGGGGSRRGGISANQAAVLEVLDDFAPEGTNRIFNQVARAGILAQEAKAAAGEMSGLLGVSTATIGVFAGIAAVGAGIVIATQNIGKEAELRLKAEEGIASAINRQILSQKESLKNFAEQQKQTTFDRLFSNSLKTDTREDLVNKRANLQQRLNITPDIVQTVENGKLVAKSNETFERIKAQILEVNAELVALEQKNTKTANDAFNERFESFKRSQESQIKAQERAVAAQEKFNKSVEDGRKKVEELGKQYSGTFDDLFARSNAENPFVAVFSEGEKALKSLRENLKGLPEELQNSAAAIQRKINSSALFETRLDNNLSVFDLRERARNLRNPRESDEQRSNRIDDGARRSVNAGNFFAGGVFGNLASYLANQAGGFDKLTDEQKLKIFEARSFGNVAGNASGSTFNTLNQNSLERSLASDRLRAGADKNLSLNERLQKQLAILDGSAGSEAEKAIAGRKFLALTSSIDPSQLSDNLRNRAALENEREADRKSKGEEDALKLQREHIKAQTELTAAITKLREVAEKEGVAGIDKLLVEIKDADNTKSKVVRATPADAGKRMTLDGGTYFEQSRQ